MYGSISLVCVLIENVGLKMGFVVAFHHMGRFKRNKGLKYVWGEIHVVKGIDPNFWSYLKHWASSKSLNTRVMLNCGGRVQNKS